MATRVGTSRFTAARTTSVQILGKASEEAGTSYWPQSDDLLLCLGWKSRRKSSSERRGNTRGCSLNVAETCTSPQATKLLILLILLQEHNPGILQDTFLAASPRVARSNVHAR